VNAGSDADPQDATARAGQLLGDRYRIEALLARGGMARVYRAHDVRLDRDVAVKVLAEPYASDAQFAARFLAEARAVAALSHPNLVHVYDSGSSGRLHYIVMELLDAHRSLAALLEQRGRLPAGEAIAIGREMLDGLAVVHQHGLVHCDVKAGNVMVGRGPTKLIDFGIARARDLARNEQPSLGSLQAMAPEQLRGDELTPATDLFAVGAVLYFALTGRVPYPGANADAVARAQRLGPPAAPSTLAPDIPPALDAVVLQALRIEPAQRFENAAAMSRALAIAAAGAHADRSRGSQRGAGRSPALAITGLLTLAIAAIVAIALMVGRDDVTGTPSSSASPSAASSALAPGMVLVPDTVGLSEADAEAKARAARLNWTIRWKKSDAHPPGVYDQEPAAGQAVKSGSRFTMFAYRPFD
jgi:eukaryotic-like serine/threonine-protein kinase